MQIYNSIFVDIRLVVILITYNLNRCLPLNTTAKKLIPA